MKIAIESTNQIIQVIGPNGASIAGRLWEGTTNTGIYVQCVITRIAAPKEADLSQFERELQECEPPTRIDLFPLQMVI